jgi:hypothetical protein
MPNVLAQIATQLPQQTLAQAVHDAGEKLRAMIDEAAYVGEAVSPGYTIQYSKSTTIIASRPAEFQRCAFCSPLA